MTPPHAPDHLSDGPWFCHRDVRIVMFSGHRNATCDPVHLLDIDLRTPGAIWIHGAALGFDIQVHAYAIANAIPVLPFPPDYKNYPPRTAPLIRNCRMLELADIVVVCYDGRQHGGTAYVVREAEKRHLPLHRIPPAKGMAVDVPR